jgi:hypothetical protein
MSESTTLDPAKIAIRSMRIVSSSFLQSQDVHSTHPLVTQITAEESARIPEKLVRIVIHIRIFESFEGSNSPDLAPKVQFSVEFLFELDDFSSWIEQKEQTAKVNSIMSGTLRGIAYSTTRGMLYQQSMGTTYIGLTLPVIDPMVIPLELDVIHENNQEH